MTPDIRASRDIIAYEMYFETADANYLGARAAFFEHRYHDFWWLTLHAVEKYLKTILLVNDRPAKKGGHDLSELLSQVLDIDQRLTPPLFVRPKVEGLGTWSIDEADAFIDRLNEFGSADNRYDIAGYLCHMPDLFMADQFVYWARRHARRLTLIDGRFANPFDRIAELASAPGDWMHWRGPIDKVAALPPRNTRRWPLVRLNAAFFPTKRHRIGRHIRAAGSVSSIVGLELHLKHSAFATRERAVAHTLFQWMLDNIVLPKKERDRIVQLLQQYP